jgi:predicted AlkP superfamily pyrophosphatase or phosphodiesterase
MIAVALAVVIATNAVSAQQVPADRRTPKLLVLLMVDQFRGDYIEHYHHQWSAGLRRLVTEGAWFRRAEYPYYNTVTCPGHSSVATGAYPAVHGMILNGWFDRTTRKATTCTDDPSAQTISYGKPINTEGESLVHLRIPTLADSLRLQLSPAARVIAFSLKARAAAPLGGRHPDAIAWFDDAGAWATSSAFSKGPVPAIADFVKRNPVENDLDKVWDRTLPKNQYLYEDPAVGITAPRGGMTVSFPHALKGKSGAADAGFYDRWQSSPFSDEYLAKMALDVAGKLDLGKGGGATNLIGISFSALDKVGHDFGPNSHENQDILIRLDRTLGAFFAGLDRLVGAGEYTVALTADHGVAPFPERVRSYGLDAGRLDLKPVIAAVEKAAAGALGTTDGSTAIERIAQTDIYFKPGVYAKLKERPGAVDAIRDALRSVDGIADVYTAEELETNRFDDNRWARRLAHSHFRGRSGDLSFTMKPYWMIQERGTTHGTGYEYDTHVPVLLMGKGIAKGEYLTSVEPTDIAPTLAFLANVMLPNATGRVLTEALSQPDAAAKAPSIH